MCAGCSARGGTRLRSHCRPVLYDPGSRLADPAQAQAAAASAAALLPDISPESLSGVRFNLDLATQPAFLAAPETSYGNAIPEWWARAGGPRGGARADWAPVAVEGGSAARQDSLRAALAARVETARLIAAVGVGLPAEGKPGATGEAARAGLVRDAAA